MARKDRKQLAQLLNRSLISMTAPKSPIAEQFRTVRTNIQFSSVDKEIKTLIVTSARPAEGKSTVVANLAVVFAQQGKKVLLIDSDMRKPTVHYTFQTENHSGLSNILARQATLNDTVHETKQDKLWVLPSGPIPPNPSELLGSKAMQTLLEQAEEEFDVILLDTPPIIAVTDAQVLANVADGVVLVVGSGKTEVDSAKKAKELLESAQAKILGVVLNNKKTEDDQYYYYYYYGGK